MGEIKLDDTIVAISTPIGEAGIGIVRLSGKDSLRIAGKIFLSKDGRRPSSFETYTVHYGHIYESRREPQIIDEVILTVMRGPMSYTKEDIVEINCHSGIVPLRKILGLVLKNGARLAGPGEFTKRAFLNGRIDISQAESVLDIIRAKTDLSLKAALNNLQGRFSKKIKEIRDRLIRILSHLEASIDFSEEDVGALKEKDILRKLRRIKKDIENFISTAHEGRVLRQGLNTVICGSPNVGKSSLMNALLKEARAIVTHIPGTTRDLIEEVANIKGIPVILVDTAGITKSGHPVVKEGVKRSRLSIQQGDLVLLVLDYGRRLKKQDLDIMRSIKGKEAIIVINKIDLKKSIDLDIVKSVFPMYPIVYVSAIKLSGIDKLEDKIKGTVFRGKAPTADFASVSNDRQLEILRRSLKNINGAVTSLKDKTPVDYIAVYVRSSIEALGRITGHTITEETLDKIFSEFCIGK